MAFMTQPTTNGSRADRTPVLAFNAKSGRLSLHDRAQDDSGEWSTGRTDVTMAQPAFAVDFGRLEVGWVHFAKNRAPLWAMAFHGQPEVPEPEPPGINATTGKPVRFKAGFRVPVVGRAIGGVREFAGNAGVIIAGMNALHDEYEAAPEARAGKLPLVKLVDVQEVQAGQSCSYQPVFEIGGWVDRPDDVLGPRTVAPPGAPRAAALRIAPAPTRHAAPDPRDDIDTIHRDRLSRTPQARAQDDREPPADRWEDAPHNDNGRMATTRPASRARVGF
jgi:hypothetical protein